MSARRSNGGRRGRRLGTDRSTRYIVYLAIVAVVGAIVGVVILTSPFSDGRPTEAAPVADYPYPVQMFAPDAGGRSHFPAGQTYDNYNSNPPTSGPHTAAANWGINNVAVPKEAAVHNMEHAGVVVWYNCNGGPQPLSAAECTQLRTDLSGVVSQAIQASKPVLMTPYPEMTNRIALTAWQFLDAFDTFDQARVQMFLDTFVCHTDLEGFC